jgi:MoaA/NifB/PqqE/SkfB family radical SAM enzyme
LGTDEWKRCFSVLDGIGIRKAAILGGEPTIVPGIERIVGFILKETRIDLSIVTNSTANMEVLENLVAVGLKRYSTSVDSVIGEGYDSYSSVKSNKAILALIRVKALGIESLTGYLVLNKKSISQVPQVVETLNSLGVWTYVIPFHHGPHDFWENRSQTDMNAFTEEDTDRIADLSQQLLKMKADGIKIANGVSYLEQMRTYAVGLNWHCFDSTSEIRIDADGTLMCCNDIRGKHSSAYSVFDLAESGGLEKFQDERSKDAINCPGCYWPSHYHAAEARISAIAGGGTWSDAR